MASEQLSNDAPITLTEAAETLLRGLVTASTLRAAAERGELTTERLGRRLVTTPASVRDWRRRCRVSAEGRTSTSSDGRMERLSGTSETVESGSQQDATKAILRGLVKPSKSTSAVRRDRLSAAVIPLGSVSRR